LVAHLTKSTPVEITLHVAEALPPLSPIVETALYRITQEALSNVVRHAQAAQVTVCMETAGGSVQLIVADNGRGFAPAPAQDTAEGATLDKGGIGLWSMRERAEEVGGTLVLRSIPSEGTTILVTVPVLGSTSREQRQSHILNQEGDGVW
jgi:signal transduction histidine kinase